MIKFTYVQYHMETDVTQGKHGNMEILEIYDIWQRYINKLFNK